MRRSKNPETIRNNHWRDRNPEKEKAYRINRAFRLLKREGVIDGEKVLFDPTKI